jgi:P27 family predicted phage terminase small subunit
MPKGRPPLPISLHRLQASYQPFRHDARALEPEAAGQLNDTKPPWWFSGSQRRRWKELIEIAPKEILRRADRELAVQYIVKLDRFHRAARAQNKLPLLQDNGTVSSYLRLERQLSERLQSLGAELGLSPTSRARLGSRAPKPEEGTDVWSDLQRPPVRDGQNQTKAA